MQHMDQTKQNRHQGLWMSLVVSSCFVWRCLVTPPGPPKKNNHFAQNSLPKIKSYRTSLYIYNHIHIMKYMYIIYIYIYICIIILCIYVYIYIYIIYIYIYIFKRDIYPKSIPRLRSKLLQLLAARLGLSRVGGKLPPAGHRHLGRLRRGSAAIRHVVGIIPRRNVVKKPWLQ